MARKQKRPAGPPIDLGDMRQLGVRGLVVKCLNPQCRHQVVFSNPQCRHQVVFSADDYPNDATVPSFQARMKCSECGGKGVDVQPNWTEQLLGVD